MVKTLGWVQRRWDEVLEPVVRRATVEQETELRALWERELDWWKTASPAASLATSRPRPEM